MSRAIIYDLARQQVGELNATLNRGWSLAGISSNSGGASVTLTLPIAAAQHPWLQFGRLVVVDHPVLRPWVGVIDTPWGALPPIKVTAYDPAFLLAQRVPDDPITLSGDIASIVSQILDLANAQEDLYLRVGDVAGVSSVELVKRIEQKPIWEQLNAFGMETGTEIMLKPERASSGFGFTGRVLVDLSPGFGTDQSFLLFDGPAGNMRIGKAVVDGDIRNRVIGISSQSSSESRVQAGPFLDAVSIATYGTRTWVEQFRDVSAQGLLEDNAKQHLADHAWPRLKLTAEIYEPAFPHLDLGNRIPVQASQVYLPGGRQGWAGTMRVLAMAYNEAKNIITVNMEAIL